MGPFNHINNMLGLFRTGFVRLRYPFSLPEEIGSDLGLDVTNQTDFKTLLSFLCSASCAPRNLKRFMKRGDVDTLFQNAFRADHFSGKSIYCYYFKQGWIEFELIYDNNNLLRRVKLQSQKLSDEGIELKLNHSQ